MSKKHRQVSKGSDMYLGIGSIEAALRHPRGQGITRVLLMSQVVPWPEAGDDL